VKKKLTSQQASSNAALLDITTETPFDKRHDCWFCGEPNQYVFTYHNAFEPQANMATLSLPSCKECCQVAKKSIAKAKNEGAYYSIWSIKSEVKRYLIHCYRKDLAIGINWTKKELEESEFEHGNFSGFQRSAWFMFEVAKARVNYTSWPLIVDGVTLLDEYQERRFHFDGVDYPNIDQAMLHYANSLSLSLDYFRSVLTLVGNDNFAKAVRFCRLLVASNSLERQQALRQLRMEMT
jgi:transcription elongation factor Elf1